MTVTLKQIFAALAFAAFSMAALTNPTAVMMVLVLSMSAIAILLSVCLAVKKPKHRAFMVWFVITASVYFGLVHIADRDGNSPRHTGPEPTTWLLRQAYEALGFEPVAVRSPQPGRFGVFCIQDVGPRQTGGRLGGDSDDVSSPHLGNFSELIELIPNYDKSGTSNLDFPSNLSGFGVHIARQEQFRRFMYIGHCILAVVIGVVAGSFAQFLYSRNAKRNLSVAAEETDGAD